MQLALEPAPSRLGNWTCVPGDLVGWKLDISMAAPLVLDALERAVQNWSNLPVYIIRIEAFNMPQATSANSWIATKLSLA
jgi:hypothetical protein